MFTIRSEIGRLNVSINNDFPNLYNKFKEYFNVLEVSDNK